MLNVNNSRSINIEQRNRLNIFLSVNEYRTGFLNNFEHQYRFWLNFLKQGVIFPRKAGKSSIHCEGFNRAGVCDDFYIIVTGIRNSVIEWYRATALVIQALQAWGSQHLAKPPDRI